MKTFKRQFRSFYTIPITYVLVFSLLSVLLHQMDKYYAFSSQSSILISSYTYGHNLSILMIGGLINLITISISLMMVVLTVYGAQFSPKTLQDFLSNKKTLHILGFLIGTLVYSIVNLFLLSNLSNIKYILSPAFGTLFFTLSVFAFVYFIRFVSQSVQINLYIQQLGKEILKDIQSKEKLILANEHVHYKKDVVLTSILDKQTISILNQVPGYLHSYDINQIISLAISNNCVILSKKQIGEYVFKDDVIFEIYNFKEDIETFQKTLLQYIEVREDFTNSNSLGFGTKKLTEIALRAMSSSTNDAATACFCIDQLGETLKSITNILAHVVYTDDKKDIRLIARKENFVKVLYDHFSQIKNHGFNDMAIIKSTLSAFIKIAQNAEDSQNEELWEFLKYMMENINFESIHRYDYEFIISDLYQIAILTNNIEEFKHLYKK
jgi:uncharacterized membrane protein